MASLMLLFVSVIAVADGIWVDHKHCGLFHTSDPYAKVPTTTPSTRIYAGDLARIGEFPWVVIIRSFFPDTNETTFCGGAILDSRWILTAQHCLVIFDGFEMTIVYGRIKELDKQYGGQLKIGKGELHKNLFSYGAHGLTGANDVALVYISGPNELPLREYNWGKINRLCLLSPGEPFKYEIGESVTLAGYGRKLPHIKKQSLHTWLTKFKGQIQDNWSCRANYWWRFSPATEFCYAQHAPPYAHSCHGDSGSPIVVYYPETEDNVPKGATLQRAVAVGIASGTKETGHDCGEIQKGWIFGVNQQDTSPKLVQYIKWITDTVEMFNIKKDKRDPTDEEGGCVLC